MSNAENKRPTRKKHRMKREREEATGWQHVLNKHRWQSNISLKLTYRNKYKILWAFRFCVGISAALTLGSFFSSFVCDRPSFQLTVLLLLPFFAKFLFRFFLSVSLSVHIPIPIECIQSYLFIQAFVFFSHETINEIHGNNHFNCYWFRWFLSFQSEKKI